MTCNWLKEEYFGRLIGGDKKSHLALEMLVDDLHTSKETTIGRFLCHSGSEDFLWGLVRLLGSDIPRVAGNSAYILGTLAESDIGCYRVLALAKGRNSDSSRILADLTRMLTFDDPESVMNAAGTMGTLAESTEGREWIIHSTCMEDMLNNVTALLHVENMWTASNAALVLARLCISEEGCNKILNHLNSHQILSKLVMSLGVDEAGRGMNAAFAIGRLCDMDVGRQRLLGLQESEKMISALAKMLSCDDTGASKNACFALSCLATNGQGHSRLLTNAYVDDVLKTLSDLLGAEDSETGWFAAMTLRTLASQPKGCLKLRENHTVHLALKATEMRGDVNTDLMEEVLMTIEILKRLEKPPPPRVEVTGPHSVRASWDKITTRSGFDVCYKVYEGNRCVFNGGECSCEVDGLSPSSPYSFRLRAYTEGDETNQSEAVQVTTEEAEPSAPVDLKILGSTITQLKVGWEPPLEPNGVIKGYHVFYGRNIVEHTTDTSIIITGLTANTSYEVQVCASTVRGRGARASIVGTTAELGAHAPSRPQVHVLGRNEVNVIWGPPEVPLGRITRYDVIMNGKTIYSGTDLMFNIRRLTPDTEYTFVIVALTNEGKFESKATKKRTSKDEYDTTRPPLYQPPPKRESVTEETIPKPILQKKRRSLTEGKIVRVPSAKNRSKTPPLESEPVRPSSADTISRQGSHTTEYSSQADYIPVNVKPSPVFRVPLSEPKKEKEKRPVSNKKDKTTRITSPSISSTTRDSSHRAIKLDKSPTVPKTMFPVSISYVSINGGDDFDMTFDPARSPEFCIKKQGGHDGSMKLERSRTSYIAAKHSSKHRQVPSDLDPDLPNDLATVTSKASFIERGGKTQLPKPSVPSQQYLDGGKTTTFSIDNSWPSRSLTSPRSGQDHSGNLEQETLVQEMHKTKRPASHHSASSSASAVLRRHNHYVDRSTTVAPYFIESHHEFLQRTNTFVSCHRPSLKKTIDRLPNKMAFPVNIAVSSGPVTFTPELPDNKIAKSHNKFVPMQLRTQPGNLTASQLQRVNTSLTETRVNGGFPARRLESLNRSHTQLAMETGRSQPSSGKRVRHLGHHGSQSHHGSEMMEMVNLTSQHLSGKEKASKHKHCPPRHLNQTGHIREPDSVLLSQSWTFRAQEEALQGAR